MPSVLIRPIASHTTVARDFGPMPSGHSTPQIPASNHHVRIECASSTPHDLAPTLYMHHCLLFIMVARCQTAGRHDRLSSLLVTGPPPRSWPPRRLHRTVLHARPHRVHQWPRRRVTRRPADRYLMTLAHVACLGRVTLDCGGLPSRRATAHRRYVQLARKYRYEYDHIRGIVIQ